jgi:hypothetical protein
MILRSHSVIGLAVQPLFFDVENPTTTKPRRQKVRSDSVVGELKGLRMIVES